MRAYIYSLYMFLSLQVAFAQQPHCSFANPKSMPDYDMPYHGNLDELKSRGPKHRKSLQSLTLEFGVQLCIFNDTENIANDEAVQSSFQRLNQALSGADIQFKLKKVRHITSSHFELLQIADESILYRHYAKPGLINVYCVPGIATENGRHNSLGYAYSPYSKNLPPYRQNMLVVTLEGLLGKSTLAHEFGHLFGLLHTHETEFGRETAARTDCKSTGDLICDTPADPNLMFKVKTTPEGCYFTDPKNDRDVEGAPYQPDVYNIMSYSNAECRHRFTQGQHYVMESTALYLSQGLRTQLLRKDQVQQPLIVLPTLADALEHHKPYAVVLALKDSLQWCLRLESDIFQHQELRQHFEPEGLFSLIIYDDEYPVESIADFLGKAVYPYPPFHSGPYGTLIQALYPKCIRFPGIFILAIDSSLEHNIHLVYFQHGYAKSKELAAQLESFAGQLKKESFDIR